MATVAAVARHIWGAWLHGERGIARAYNGGLEAEPLARSRGRALGQRVRGAKPP